MHRGQGDCLASHSQSPIRIASSELLRNRKIASMTQMPRHPNLRSRVTSKTKQLRERNAAQLRSFELPHGLRKRKCFGVETGRLLTGVAFEIEKGFRYR